MLLTGLFSLSPFARAFAWTIFGNVPSALALKALGPFARSLARLRLVAFPGAALVALAAVPVAVVLAVVPAAIVAI